MGLPGGADAETPGPDLPLRTGEPDEQFVPILVAVAGGTRLRFRSMIVGG